MLSPRATAAIDRIVDDFHSGGAAPGMVVGVVADRAVVHTTARGVTAGERVAPTIDSVFRIASMTKSFTAAAILLLRDEGALELDDRVDASVPEVGGATLPDGSPPLTIRHLLTMSGGLPTDDPWADRQESLPPDAFAALLSAGVRFSAVPGTSFQYSNLGYAILGRVVAAVAGSPYRDVVRTRLLEPLGLAATVFDVAEVPTDRLVVGHRRDGDGWIVEPFDRPGEFSPIGGLCSSVRDLATWVGGFVDADVDADVDGRGHPVSAAGRREMQQLQRFSEVEAMPDGGARATGYGCGLMVEHDTRWGVIVGHPGGYPGFGSSMRWHPTSGVGVIALGNATYVPMSVPALDVLHVALTDVAAPARVVRRWPETDDARFRVQQLIESWDDRLADALFAENVDLDQPRAQRRAEVEAAVRGLGAPIDHELRDVSSDSAADAEWDVHGEHGVLHVDIQLTPEPNPRVQTLGVVLHPHVDPTAVDTDVTRG